jgi:chromate reductase
MQGRREPTRATKPTSCLCARPRRRVHHRLERSCLTPDRLARVCTSARNACAATRAASRFWRSTTAARTAARSRCSLRKASFNRKVAHALVELAPAGLTLAIVEIGQLPIYNQDGDENRPAEWTAFRERIRAADAVLFVTPEHNRSVPAALKNAIDVGSRPYGKNAWNGKPGAVVTASPGGIGGFGSNHHLRQSLVFLNAPAMAQPEAYIGGVDKLFDTNGKLANDGPRKFLESFMQAYAKWIAARRRDRGLCPDGRCGDWRRDRTDMQPASP